MKAYKRKNIAMLALMASIAMTGVTAFASTDPVSPNDISNKSTITKMHKDAVVDAKVSQKSSKKKHAKSKSKKVAPVSIKTQ